ncbi:MAG: glycoside hydrolase 15-related [Ilumatobacteraceae bacterium]|nr:glycoside hydrolase 15-related [Ilumatobacteraceae bacterium]
MAGAKSVPAQPYLSIGEYAFLSDCHSTALVSRHGSVDWACFRRFDSATAFCRLLDHDHGGHFSISACDAGTFTRGYLDGTLVLSTTITTNTGEARLTEAMVMRQGGSDEPHHELVRIIDGIDGSVEFDIQLMPRFDYGCTVPMIRQVHDHEYTAVGGSEGLIIQTDAPLAVDRAPGGLLGRVEVHAGSSCRFLLTARAAHQVEGSRHSDASYLDDADERLRATIEWWQRWSHTGTDPGRFEKSASTSVRVLKGLTCAPTGAVIAAATTSLPEEPGGTRNWDYRYSWVRDSSLVLDALVGTGHAEIAAGFHNFLVRSAAGNADDLQIMYGAYGERRLPELELRGLEGWRRSSPVRIGNGASTQVQLDVYGHLLDAVDTWHDGTSEFDPAERNFLRKAVDIAATRWREPDQGIWEMRGEPRHFVNSKVMCWVAVDRGIGLGPMLHADDEHIAGWQVAADELREEIMTSGVDPARGCFRQHYGTVEVDASLLKLPLVGFIAPNHPAMLATVEAIQHDLVVGESGFIRRYTANIDDGVAEDNDEGVFLLATCWLVEVLTLQGRVAEAVALFERIRSCSNDLGLYSEEFDVRSGELLGNFPQAFTHLGVLIAARRLDAQS